MARPAFAVLLFAVLASCKPDAPADDTDKPGDSGDTGPGDTDETGLPDTVLEALDAVREAVPRDLQGSYGSGAQVCIWRQGRVVMNEGFGTAHPSGSAEVGPETLFQIGSDTKKLAAITLLQQIEAGRASLDSTLAELVPELVFDSDGELAGSITLHQLMSQQTTLYDYTPWDSAPDDAELRERALGPFAEREYSYAPAGSFWSYSNPNYSLVGLVAETLDGRPWADIVTEDVFEPLGMSRSFPRLAEAAAAGDYATGTGVIMEGDYTGWEPFGDFGYRFGAQEMEDQVDNGFIRPAGLVWSTARDSCALAGFLMHGDPAVLSDALRSELGASQVPVYPFADGYGYGYGLMSYEGFFIGNDYYEEPLWAHGGNTMTMTSAFYVLPERDVAISILDNGYGSSFGRTLVAALEGLGGLGSPGTFPGYAPPSQDLASYAGTYEDPHLLGTVEISYASGGLKVVAPDLEAMGVELSDELQPTYLDYFLIDADGLTLEIYFADAADGTPHAYLHNRQFGAIRVDDAQDAPPPPARTPEQIRARLFPQGPLRQPGSPLHPVFVRHP